MLRMYLMQIWFNLSDEGIEDSIYDSYAMRTFMHITSTADWQINRLKIPGYSSEDIENALKDTLNASYLEMFELYDKVIDWEYVRNKDIYEQINAEYIPFEENKHLIQVTSAIKKQSLEDLENITRSLGFYLDYGGRKVLTPLSQVYSRYLDNACMDIVTVWSQQQLYDVCGLGTVTGLCGANCYHTYFPFVPGVSVRTYTDGWLDEQNRKESEPTEFRGKEYTLYEAKQRQRQMETAMRAQREKVQLLQKGGADPQEVMLQKAKYQGQLNEYAVFSRKMGLKEERERIYIDGRGRVAPSKDTLRTAQKIMNTDYLFERGKIANIMGVNKNAIDFGKMDEKSKKSVYNGIKKVFAQFPELRGYTNKVLYDPDIKGYAMSKSMQGVLKIGSKFSNYKELKRRYDRDVRMQFHPAGTNADAIIIHEMGHQLDGYLTQRGVWGGNVSLYGTTRTSVAVKREVLQQLGYFDYIRAERAEWTRMGYKGRELNEALEFSKKEFITKHISEYANKNEREFFAECFAEYLMSARPREAAKIFGEVLEKIMEGLR